MVENKSGVSGAEDDVAALVALRDRLAVEIDCTDSAQILAVLSRQFMAVITQLAELKPTAPSRVDEIADKYARKLKSIRGADTSDTEPSGGAAQSG